MCLTLLFSTEFFHSFWNIAIWLWSSCTENSSFCLFRVILFLVVFILFKTFIITLLNSPDFRWPKRKHIAGGFTLLRIPYALSLLVSREYEPIEVLRNEILAACQPGKNLCVELIHISEFMDSEIRITFTFRFSCQADRLPGCQISFRKTSIVFFNNPKPTFYCSKLVHFSCLDQCKFSPVVHIMFLLQPRCFPHGDCYYALLSSGATSSCSWWGTYWVWGLCVWQLMMKNKPTALTLLYSMCKLLTGTQVSSKVLKIILGYQCNRVRGSNWDLFPNQYLFQRINHHPC